MKNRLSSVLVVVLVLALLSAFTSAASAAVIRVKPDGDDANSGASWALAKKTVQAAIDAAAEGDEIWVAAGTYIEHIKNKVIDPVIDPVAVNVALYGGFLGTETQRDQRNWMTNLTVLDGGNPIEPPPPPAVGSVVYISGGAGRATRVDGFVITGGNAIAGGGILIEGSGPTVANNNIWGNSASIGGGIGVSNYDILPPTLSHPVITDNRIFGNSAVEGGGGIAVVGSETLAQSGFDPAAPVIARNVISQNKCMMNGGGLGCWGHTAAVIENNVIVANAAANDESTFAGGGGGIYATSRDLDDQPLSYAICAPLIVSNAIVANGGFLGAGIQCWDTEDAHGGIPVITNNTIVSNNGIGIYWRESSPVMTNNLVAFNPWGLQQPAGAPTSPTISHNNVYGNSVRGQRTDYLGIADQTGLSGNISIDPLLANARIGDIRIQPGSPCRDAGLTSVIEDGWKDIQGEDRIQGNGVDIGADESDGTAWSVPTPVIRVRPDGDDAEDGSTWAKAKRTIGAGITAAFLGGGAEVWVAEGTYVERNAVNAFIYLYGGFAGTETSRDQRDFVAHPTVLDGGGVPNVITVGRAGYLTSAIDGFTIRNGGEYTDGAYPVPQPRYGGRGGGINCRQGSPLIENNIITRNSVGDPLDYANKPGYGAGLYIYMYFGLIRGNTFEENEVLDTFEGSGGGIHVFYSMPTIQGNTFARNHAESGAAIYATLSQPDIIGNTVEDNDMYVFGSLYTGAAFGAIQLYMNEDFLVRDNTVRGNTAAAGAGITATTNGAGKILNNLVTGNVAENAQQTGGMGGGMYLLVQDSATSDLIVANNTVVGNTATIDLMPWPMNEQGGGIALSLTPPMPPPPDPPPAKIVLANNVVAFNSSGIWQYPMTPMLVPTLVNNDVFGSTSGENCNYMSLSPGATDISLDPAFVGAGDYHLQAASPCVDAGDNGRVPILLTADLEGKPRIIDGDGDASAVVDMGVYEFTSGTDGVAPTVTITAPTANPTYVTSQAVIDLVGTASDNVGVTGVTWSNNRGGGGTCNGATNWTAEGILLFLGQNVITVTARDQVVGGNTGADVLTVTYALTTYALSVTSAHGTVLIDPDQPAYEPGSEVTVTAIPAADFSFVSWTGDLSSSDNPLNLIMDRNISLVANYAYQGLTVSGTVTLDGAPLADVLMSGLPGNPVTDSGGFYMGYVSSGSSLIVTPILDGYSFAPDHRTYDPISENKVDQDYFAGPGDTPMIILTSPDGGEAWVAGSDHVITWLHSGLTGSASVDLYKGGLPLKTLGTVDITAGSFLWSIDAAESAADDYRIRVSQGETWGESNADFTIVGASLGLRFFVKDVYGYYLWMNTMLPDESFEGWQPLQGGTSTAAAVATYNNRLHVVVKDAFTNALWHQSMDSEGAWSGWTMLDKESPSTPSLAVFGDRLYLAVREPDNRISCKSMGSGGTWGEWTDFPGATNTTPVLAAFNGKLHLVVKDLNFNFMWWNSMDTTGTWSGWQQLSGESPSPVAMAEYNDKLYMFVRGNTDDLYFRSMDTTGAWGPWTMMVGGTSIQPTVAEYNGRLYLVVKDANGYYIWMRSMDETETFGDWAMLPGGTSVPIALARF